VNTNNGVKWRRFIAPKKLNKLMTSYRLMITYEVVPIGHDSVRIACCSSFSSGEDEQVATYQLMVMR